MTGRTKIAIALIVAAALAWSSAPVLDALASPAVTGAVPTRPGAAGTSHAGTVLPQEGWSHRDDASAADAHATRAHGVELSSPCAAWPMAPVRPLANGDERGPIADGSEDGSASAPPPPSAVRVPSTATATATPDAHDTVVIPAGPRGTWRPHRGSLRPPTAPPAPSSRG